MANGIEANIKDSFGHKLYLVLRCSESLFSRDAVFGSLEADKRTFSRGDGTTNFKDNFYNFDTYVVGKFATGNIQHQIITGLNLSREDTLSINGDRASF
ncbi:hypothetical protein [Nostoc sp.]|uniref:hypothetical protein n=1 Tax=Nostoc sp. TaxID=1180 RepID=UPI002FFB34AC